MRQLTLGVRLTDRSVLGNFLAGDNSLALAAVSDMAAAGGSGGILLHGVSGSGKSHLLQALCSAVPGAALLPLETLAGLGPGVLEGAAALPLVAIDDIDRIAGDPAWEQALFRLYNERRGGGLAVAAAAPATNLGLRLPDLVSRLAALPHYALRPLDEVQQRQALQLRARLRGFELPEETVVFLQRRFPRDMTRLAVLLDELDAASLAEQRRVTVPFIRQVLGMADGS
ncbi:MAG TPA: DnaA regulatory inactivator Hda [Steroidobacteraceae bacterium]|nr:DnaA regulatory inactivator Hda [Steroidobacteraceae bacterium]